MSKILKISVLISALAVSIATSTLAETKMHPEATSNDPRMTEIQKKLQNVYGKGRALTTLTTAYVSSNPDERRRVESILNNMLLEAGAEPVLKSSQDYFQYKLNLDSSASDEYGTVTQNLRLNLIDVRSRVGERLIMTSSATISCAQRTSNGPRYQCPLDDGQIREIFLRLR